jgi:hypothetical protein
MTDTTVTLILAGLAASGVLISAVLIRSRIVWFVLAFSVATYAVPAYLISYLQGTPKAKVTETARPKVAEVLFSKVVPKKKIYLVLNWPGLTDPKYYWIDWTSALEKDLMKAKQNAQARHSPLMVRDPFSEGLEGDDDGDGSGSGAGKGKGKKGTGTGGGDGPDTGDNAGAEGGRFYAAPPAPLPEKFIGTP